MQNAGRPDMLAYTLAIVIIQGAGTSARLAGQA